MAEPVTLAEAKQTLWMENDDSKDTLITSLIAPARAYVEKLSRCLFVEGERTEPFRRWGDYLEIWRRPIVSVDSVTYSTSDDPADDIEYTGFVADYNSFPLRIYPAFGGTGFPTLVSGQTITVTYTAGALATTSEDYLIGKQAILFVIKRWFNEEDLIGQISGDAKRALDDMLQAISPLSAY